LDALINKHARFASENYANLVESRFSGDLLVETSA